MLTRLPTLSRRPSQVTAPTGPTIEPSSSDGSAAPVPAATVSGSAISATALSPSTPASPSAVVSKPLHAITRFGSTFFNRKTMAVTKKEGVATPSRPARIPMGDPPVPQRLVRRGSTETDLVAGAPSRGITRFLQQRGSARNVVPVSATTETTTTPSTTTTSTIEPVLKTQVSSVKEELAAGTSKDTESRQPVQAIASSATLVPQRPPTNIDSGSASFGSAIPGRRPILSKKLSASESTMLPLAASHVAPSSLLASAAAPPRHKAASFRNLIRFDRAKSTLATTSVPASLLLPNVSQKSIHSSRESGAESSELVHQLHWQFVLDHHGDELTPYEKQEITKFDDVYYYASQSIKARRHNGKIIAPPTPQVVPPVKSGESSSQGSASNSSGEIQLRPSATGTRDADLFNDGFDDEHGDYVMLMQDHLGYRYEVLHPLGSGSFGQVVCCVDHATKNKVAVKVIRNRKKYKEQALIEIEVLTQLQERAQERAAPAGSAGSPGSSGSTGSPGPTGLSGSSGSSGLPGSAGSVAGSSGRRASRLRSSPKNVVQMIDSFVFRNHLCITFELLGMNLYEYLKLRFFQGMPMQNIRVVTRQLLHALSHLHTKRIIHCDLKPENVLIKTPLQCFGAGPGRSSVAYANVPIENVCLIDFGSSCLDNATIYTYIQSRFYRSPEVILGHAYDTAIDMWSLGCIVVELYTGHPIFAGENETEQLMCMMEILGVPPPSFLVQCKRRKYFFQEVPAATDPASTTTTADTTTTSSSVSPVAGATVSSTPVSGVVYKPMAFTNSRGRRRAPGLRDLVAVLRSDDSEFIAFVRKCFVWDPTDRLTPDAALQEPWLAKEDDSAAAATAGEVTDELKKTR